MIELGGYWAFYSLWFLSRGKHRRSIVVEPDPKHLEVGKINARLNGLAPTFVNGFVFDSPAPSVLFKTEESGEILLPRLSVPLLMEIQAIERLNVLHCDIQGAEFNVLCSCKELFERRQVEFVFVSTHDFRISGDPLTHQRCLQLIRNCNGRIVAAHDVHESYSGDGLIVVVLREQQPLCGSCADLIQQVFRQPLPQSSLRSCGSASREQSTRGSKARPLNLSIVLSLSTEPRGVIQQRSRRSNGRT